MDRNQIMASQAKLAQEFPLIPYTGGSCLFSSVRRMKAEKEVNLPIGLRSGFAISVKTGKSANDMTEQEWEIFYQDLCNNLKRDCPERYYGLFPERENNDKY